MSATVMGAFIGGFCAGGVLALFISALKVAVLKYTNKLERQASIKSYEKALKALRMSGAAICRYKDFNNTLLKRNSELQRKLVNIRDILNRQSTEVK